MSATPSTAGTARAVFLDVDGTYADYGVVPEGHVRAVRAARDAGSSCARGGWSMLPKSILAASFDGLVASAGTYAEVARTVLVDRRFPADLTVRALDGHDAVYVVEAQEALHVAPAALERLQVILDAHFEQAPEGPVGSFDILRAVRPAADRAAVPFAKVSVFDSPVAMEHLVGEIGGAISVVATSVADEGRPGDPAGLRASGKAPSNSGDSVNAARIRLNGPRKAVEQVGHPAPHGRPA